MAKFIKEMHGYIDFLTGKGQTGYHSPEQKDDAIHVASRALYDEKRKEYERTREITIDLVPFLSNADPLSINTSNGQALFTSSGKYIVSISAAGKSVKEVDKGRWENKINDPLCPPTTVYPIFTIYKNFLQFYPYNLTDLNITYLSEPARAKWAYTIVSNRFVYDDASSIDIPWGEENHNEIMFRALEYLGLNLREGALMQFSQYKKREVN